MGLGFIRTFLERDLAEFGIRIRFDALRRFWTMIAHYHGQIWNGAELARAFGIAGTTVRHYLDTLSAALALRQLQPRHESVGKRQVKSPKVFVGDSGVMHALLGLESNDDLQGHPKVGASWEGFAGGEVVTHLGARREECFFWATHGGAGHPRCSARRAGGARGAALRTRSPRTAPCTAAASSPSLMARTP